MKRISKSLLTGALALCAAHTAFASYPCTETIIYQAICHSDQGFLRVDKTVAEQSTRTDKTCERVGKVSTSFSLMAIGQGKLTLSRTSLNEFELDLSRQDSAVITLRGSSTVDSFGRSVEFGEATLPGSDTDNGSSALQLRYSNGEQEKVELSSCVVRRGDE